MRHRISSPPHDKTAKTVSMGALWGNKSPPVRSFGGKKLIFLKGAIYGKKEE